LTIKLHEIQNNPDDPALEVDKLKGESGYPIDLINLIKQSANLTQQINPVRGTGPFRFIVDRY